MTKTFDELINHREEMYIGFVSHDPTPGQDFESAFIDELLQTLSLNLKNLGKNLIFTFCLKFYKKSTRYVFRRNILELNSVSSILFISLNNKISGNLNVPHCSFSLTSQYQVFLLQQHSFLFPIQSSQIISNKILSGWVHTEGFHIFSKRGFKTRFYLFIYLQYDDVISICIWKST